MADKNNKINDEKRLELTTRDSKKSSLIKKKTYQTLSVETSQ